MGTFVILAALALGLIPVALRLCQFVQTHPRISSFFLDLIGLLAIPPLAVMALYPLTQQASAGSEEWQLLFTVFMLGAKPLLIGCATLLSLGVFYRVFLRRV